MTGEERDQRRQEDRRLNMETFGQAAPRRGGGRGRRGRYPHRGGGGGRSSHRGVGKPGVTRPVETPSS